jgi:hypothetical protein
MQSKNPLTPALSPSDGEREEIRRLREWSPNGDGSRRRKKAFPLPIGWGEGQGEGIVPLNTHGIEENRMLLGVLDRITSESDF